MKFQNRWKIEGTLTTRTSLRIGDGDSLPANERLAETYIKQDAEVSTVATDENKKPYIPASAIKGNLRSWATKNQITEKNPNGIFSKAEIEIIFGSTDPRDEDAKAGKVQFSNAYVIEPDSTEVYKNLPDWSEERLTAVSASIAVNRKTRTASDKKLFHQEYVPAGITFDFELFGNDYEEESLKSDALLIKLLVLLKGFANGVRIGAETSDANESWGKIEWSLTNIKRSTKESIEAWLKDENAASAEFLQVLPNQNDLQKEAEAQIISSNSQPVNLSLSLECAEDFLVNDPSKAKTPKEIEEADPNNKKPNHSPLRNKNGFPVLPKSSIKGAIRSQAEKILRTIAVNIKEDISDESLKNIACYPDDMSKACEPLKDKNELPNLCLACRIFGASGWKSIFNPTDFTAHDTFEKLIKREFVGIDRFTGGVSGSNKFNAEVAHQPGLSGNITIDLARLGEENRDWAIGLLALTFRDLIEGDIRIGFGRSKGFGAIRAKIDDAESLGNLFGKTREELIDSVRTLEKKVGGKINGVS